jgi:transposase, IS30 family
VVVKMGRPGAPRPVRVEFWELVRAGVAPREAAVRAGTGKGWQNWFRQAGGVKANGMCPVSGRYLQPADREEIALGLAAGDSLRVIAARIGRPASTVCREVRRNRDAHGRYRALAAQATAEARAARPKTAKLAADPVLAGRVQHWLERKWSPQQISVQLAADFPDRPEMRVSPETIYQSLYVQGRGALRRELATCLRTGRALRKPRRAGGQARHGDQGRIPGMVMISERPAEAADRAVPGHWEGDLIIGTGSTAIGTLVERSTRYVLLLHLPARHDGAAVAAAMAEAMAGLPAHLRRSLTWDQGKEMSRHAAVTVATGLPVYFCDPHSPWQRGSNENTNGLLRQYFPKGTRLNGHSKEHLAHVAAELNGRPRQTLGWRTPAEALNDVLSAPGKSSTVATTP